MRRGIIVSFSPNYQRVEDIEWTLRFVWSQRGDRRPARAASNPDPISSVQAAQNRLDDAAAVEPPGILERAYNAVTTGVSAVRRGVSEFTVALAEVQTVAEVASSRVQQVQTALQTVTQAARALRGEAVDFPYQRILPLDDVSQIFAAENWQRSVGRGAADVSTESTRAANAVLTRAVPGVLAIVEIRQNQTLHALALEWYGSADAWPVIADANGLTSSIVVAGTVLIIPRAANAESGVVL